MEQGIRDAVQIVARCETSSIEQDIRDAVEYFWPSFPLSKKRAALIAKRDEQEIPFTRKEPLGRLIFEAVRHYFPNYTVKTWEGDNCKFACKSRFACRVCDVVIQKWHLDRVLQSQQRQQSDRPLNVTWLHISM